MRPNGLVAIVYAKTVASINILRLTLCSDVECSSSTIRNLDGCAQSGCDNPSFAARSTGIVVGVYRSSPSLLFAYCVDVACSNINTTVIVNSGVGGSLSMQLTAQDLPVIAYIEVAGVNNMRIAACQTVNCSSFTILPTIASSTAIAYLTLQLLPLNNTAVMPMVAFLMDGFVVVGTCTGLQYVDCQYPNRVISSMPSNSPSISAGLIGFAVSSTSTALVFNDRGGSLAGLRIISCAFANCNTTNATQQRFDLRTTGVSNVAYWADNNTKLVVAYGNSGEAGIYVMVVNCSVYSAQGSCRQFTTESQQLMTPLTSSAFMNMVPSPVTGFPVITFIDELYRLRLAICGNLRCD